MNEWPTHAYGGARALGMLHEHHLCKFVATWREAKATGMTLPPTDDPNYASMEVLLHHVLRAARGYMVWICEQLELPDPAIDPAPAEDLVEAEADAYLAHLLERWRTPLVDAPANRFYRPEYPSRWKTRYCIDAMLEHAVMHPIRHRWQLLGLLEDDRGD